MNLTEASIDNSQWSPLKPFGGTGAIGSPGGTHPLATDGNIVHGVWMQRGNIYYQVSRNAGRTWEGSIPLTSGTAAQYPCSLELSGKTLHLIWPDSRHGKWEIFYKRSIDSGETWGEDTRLTPGIDLFRLGTAVSGSAIHIVWGSRRSATQTDVGLHTWGEIYYKRSLDNGVTWEPTIRLTEPDNSAMRPSIATWNNYVYVNWFDQRNSKCAWDWDIYCKRSIDRGATWEDAVRMNDTPYHSRHPQIFTSPEGRVCCLWEDGSYYDGTNWTGDAALYVSLSDDHGQTWSDSERLTFINAPNSWATHSKSYACGSRIHLVWTDSPEGPNSRQAAYYMTSGDGGVSWNSAEQLVLATESNPHEVWAQAITGTESYAVALISTPDGLHYKRRDLSACQDGSEPK